MALGGGADASGREADANGGDGVIVDENGRGDAGDTEVGLIALDGVAVAAGLREDFLELVGAGHGARGAGLDGDVGEEFPLAGRRQMSHDDPTEGGGENRIAFLAIVHAAEGMGTGEHGQVRDAISAQHAKVDFFICRGAELKKQRVGDGSEVAVAEAFGKPAQLGREGVIAAGGVVDIAEFEEGLEDAMGGGLGEVERSTKFGK